MGSFNDFQKDQLETIISLPYRVGAWMMRVDDQASSRDEKREMRALKAVLESLDEPKKWPFLAAVVQETISHRKEWPAWAARKGLAEDIAASSKVMASILRPEEVVQFKKALYHIASTVAQAAGDDNDLHTEALIGELMAKLSDRLFDPLEKNPENISSVEKAALQKLKEALKG